MSLETLQATLKMHALRVRTYYWPRLLVWLNTTRKRSLFFVALAIGLVLSVPVQCSRLLFNGTKSEVSQDANVDASGLPAPGIAGKSITKMPRAGEPRPVQAPTETAPEPADVIAPEATEAKPAVVVADPNNREAVPLVKVAPKYPARALRNGDSGTVLVRVTIDAKGNPQKASVEQSANSWSLDREARSTVMKWTFSPKIENGVAVPSELLIPIDFKLGE